MTPQERAAVAERTQVLARLPQPVLLARVRRCGHEGAQHVRSRTDKDTLAYVLALLEVSPSCGCAPPR